MPATSSAATPARLGAWSSLAKGLRLAAHILVGFGVLLALPLAGRRAGGLAGWWYRRLLRILGVRVDIRGRHPDGPRLVAANHVSWLDIILLGGLLDAVFVSKAEVGDWPVVGRFARHTGTVFLPRGAGRTREATERLTAALRQGRSVVLFPEATTSAELLPARFHARLFAAAIEAGVPVQPVAVHYLPEGDAAAEGHHPAAPWVDEAGLAGHFAQVFKLRGLTARVTFCTEVPPLDRERRALASTSHQRILEALSAPADPAADASG